MRPLLLRGDDDCESMKKPGIAKRHADAPACESAPLSQALQPNAPAVSEKEPAGHGSQDFSPALLWCRPGEHSVHVVEPSSAENFPAPQLSQAGIPASAALLPGSQGRH